MKNCWASPAPFSLAYSGTTSGGGQGSDKAFYRFRASAGRGESFPGPDRWSSEAGIAPFEAAKLASLSVIPTLICDPLF